MIYKYTVLELALVKIISFLFDCRMAFYSVLKIIHLFENVSLQAYWWHSQ